MFRGVKCHCDALMCLYRMRLWRRRSQHCCHWLFSTD